VVVLLIDFTASYVEILFYMFYCWFFVFNV